VLFFLPIEQEHDIPCPVKLTSNGSRDKSKVQMSTLS